MRSLFAFMKKEWLEQLRSGHLLLLVLLFAGVGIMNPAVAKLTPWMLEVMADSLAESGMTVTSVTVSAMDSWVQFFKNMPIALIAFLLIECGILSREYQSGTLVLALTRGMTRTRVLLAKGAVLLLLWSTAYALCAGITYAYNAYFWDNSVAQNLGTAILCWWLFGVFVISLSLLFCVVFTSSSGVLAGVGGVVLCSFLLEFFPRLKEFLPTRLCDGNSLIYGILGAGDYLWATVIAVGISLASIACAIPLFCKKQL